MIVSEILAEYLKEHGFDGLCSDNCGCPLDDLCCCGEDCSQCVPGYRVQPPEGEECDFWITEKKP